MIVVSSISSDVQHSIENAGTSKDLTSGPAASVFNHRQTGCVLGLRSIDRKLVLNYTKNNKNIKKGLLSLPLKRMICPRLRLLLLRPILMCMLRSESSQHYVPTV